MIVTGRLKKVTPATKPAYWLLKPTSIAWDSSYILVPAAAFKAGGLNAADYKNGDEVEVEVISCASRVLIPRDREP